MNSTPSNTGLHKIQIPKYTMTQPCRYGWFTSMVNDVQTISVAFQGDSLPVEGEILCSLLQPGQTVIDVGASCGSLALPFAYTIGPRGRVFAFEPQRLPYQCLVANAITNSLSHIIFPAQLVIGKECGEMQVPVLDPASENFGGCSLIDERKEDAPTELVPMITIDSIVELPACHLLKVDVEGMEADVLQGAYKTIAKYRPVLWVEHLDYVPWRNDTKATLLQFFNEHDYNCWKVKTPTFSPNNIRRQSLNPFAEGCGDQNLLALPRGVLPPDLSKFYCVVEEFQ